MHHIRQVARALGEGLRELGVSDGVSGNVENEEVLGFARCLGLGVPDVLVRLFLDVFLVRVRV